MIHGAAWMTLWMVAFSSSADGPAGASGSTAPPGVDAATEAVLDRLERAGNKVRGLRSDLTFETFNTVLEDRIIKKGLLIYKKQEPNAMFLVRFDRVIQGGVISENREYHLFDGRWYTEARPMTRQVIKREIVREGEHLNPFELGKGPFPLPFGQKKDRMLRLFDITLLPPVRDDPKGCAGLKCVPRPGTEMADKYNALHLFVSDKLDLPVRIVADQTDDNLVTVSFEDLRVNPGIAGSDFALPKETRNWDVEVEELPPAPPK